MNRTRSYRWVRRAVWGTLAVLLAVGCNPLTTAAFLFRSDAKKPADFPLKYAEGSKKAKEKEEIKVALFVSPGTGLSFEFAGAESQLASELVKKLTETAKENKQKLTVVALADVQKFKQKNPNWKHMHPSAWGKALDADFVLDIHLDKMSLYQPGSSNTLYEGRAEVSVDMYEVDAGNERKDGYILPFSYPETGFRDATSIPLGTFKRAYLDNLAVKIAQKHMDYKPSSGIAE